jgi:hypothetical protein
VLIFRHTPSLFALMFLVSVTSTVSYAAPSGTVSTVPDGMDGDRYEVRKPKVWLVEDRRHPESTILRKLPRDMPVKAVRRMGSWWRVEVLDGSRDVGWVLASLLVPSVDPAVPTKPVDSSPTVALSPASEGAEPVLRPKGDTRLSDPKERARLLPQAVVPVSSSSEVVTPHEEPAAFLPAPASTSVDPGSITPTPPWSSVILWLFLLLAALGTAAWLVVRRSLDTDDQGVGLEVVRNVGLDRNTRLALVRAADRLLVVSCSGDGMSLLADTPADDDAPDVVQRALFSG